jgi:restriction endonuclease S subunit
MREGWVETTFGALAKWTSGKNLPLNLRDDAGSVPIAGANGQIGRTEEVLYDQPIITVGRVGACGEVHMWSSPVWVSDNALIAIPNPEIELKFLVYALQSFDFELIISGTTQPLITQGKLKEQLIRVPPNCEQRRIVDVIESVDNYITALETRAETARTARSALLHDLLSNPGPDWVETTFGKICSIDAQLVDPKKPEYRDLPHLAIEKIESRTGRIFPLASASDDGVISSKFLFTKDEVVYSKIRPELRKACRPGFAGLASADAYPLRPMNGCSAEFLLALVLSEGFSQIAVERSARTKMPKLNRIDLFSIPVQLPSLSDQFRIAELLVDFENLEIRIAATLNQSRGLRDALLSDLLSGNHEIPASYDQLLGAA